MNSLCNESLYPRKDLSGSEKVKYLEVYGTREGQIFLARQLYVLLGGNQDCVKGAHYFDDGINFFNWLTHREVGPVEYRVMKNSKAPIIT